jgi:hypothetical protein
MATSAASTRLGIDRQIMKVSRSRKDWLMPRCANGPTCLMAAQTAKAVSTKLTLAVSRGPRRSAAQTSGTMMRKPSGLVYSERGSSGLSEIRPTRTAPPSMSPMRPSSSRVTVVQSVAAHSTIAGVTTSAPVTSPSHQVTQMTLKSLQLAKPASASVVTPIMALSTVAGPTQIATNLATRAGVENVSRPPDQCAISQPPTVASSVLPSAMQSEVVSVPAVVRLAAKAAAKIAGQTRGPHKSTAASATPVDGQIGVALGLTEANRRPSLASTK